MILSRILPLQTCIPILYLLEVLVIPAYVLANLIFGLRMVGFPLNNGQAIAFWPVPERSCPGDYLSLAVVPEITPTGIAHYQHEVLDAIHEYSLTGFSSRLGCTLSEAFQTLQVLSPSFDD